MDYEKKYKEALERAKSALNDETISNNTIAYLQDIFPELKESEDEKIKKELIDAVQGLWDNDALPMPLSAKRKDAWIAWLEKQGEQKPIDTCDSSIINGKEFPASEKRDFGYFSEPIDKVEPKFKVGDWVVSPNGVYWHIDAIQNGRYEVTTDTGQCGNWPLDTNIYRLWTIQDAKDGDVLVDSYSKDSIIILYKGIYKERSILVHCGWNGYNLSVTSNDGLGYGGLDNTDYLPATKEQRDLLFQKMKEAGYIWYSESKQLLSLETEPNVEQNPAWSEEDEERLKSCLNILQAKGMMGVTDTINTKWLKSLKQRIGG